MGFDVMRRRGALRATPVPDEIADKTPHLRVV
jgi:hypothetical protein